MSRGALIAIVAGIIVAAVVAGVIAMTSGDEQKDVPENGEVAGGRQLILELNESLSLEENQ